MSLLKKSNIGLKYPIKLTRIVDEKPVEMDAFVKSVTYEDFETKSKGVRHPGEDPSVLFESFKRLSSLFITVFRNKDLEPWIQDSELYSEHAVRFPQKQIKATGVMIADSVYDSQIERVELSGMTILLVTDKLISIEVDHFNRETFVKQNPKT